MKKQQTQSGFAAVELVLILIIVTLVGFVGWTVYNNRAKDTSTTSSTNQSANKKDTPTEASSTKTEPVANKNVIKIPEIGVQITVPDSIKDLTYVIEKQTDMNGNPVVYARLSTQSLTALSSDCSATRSALGVMARGEGTYPNPNDPNTYQYYNALAKQFDGFFVGYGKSQALCSSEPSTAETTQLDQTQILNSSLTTLAKL